MKILVVAPSNVGTIASCSKNLFGAMSCLPDNEVRLVYINKKTHGLVEFDDKPYCNDYSNNHRKNIFAEIRFLRKIKKDVNPDLTISTHIKASILNVLAGGNDAKFGIFHAPYEQAKAFGCLYYIKNYISYILILSRLDKYLCVSQTVAENLKKIKVFRKEDIEVVYNVHQSDLIRKKAEEYSILSTEEKRIFEKPVILYLGRLDGNKAPMRAFDGFIRSDRNKDCNLVFIGHDDDNLWPEIQSKANRLGYDDNVHYLGHKNNPYPYLSRSKCLISTSYSEGLPGVMIESLILGTPVITTNSSRGNWEILSVDGDYNERLQTFFVSEDGIITSNLSSVESRLYDADIKNISDALNFFFDNKFMCPFCFKDQVSPIRIAKHITHLFEDMI